MSSGLRISDEHFLSVYRRSRILDCLASGWFELSLADAEPQAMRLSLSLCKERQKYRR